MRWRTGNIKRWFAWRPVALGDGSLVWLEWVDRAWWQAGHKYLHYEIKAEEKAA